MKFKGLTKIALAGAAVAVTAGTLATSTYAWYVTNNTASAKNITIVTKSGDGGNLLLDQAKSTSAVTRTGDAVTTLQLTTANVTGPATGLVPTTPIALDDADSVTDATTFATAKALGTLYTVASSTITHVGANDAYDEDATYKVASLATTRIDAWVDAQGAVQANPYVEFKIWINNTSGTGVTVDTFKVTNTTLAADQTTQTVYSRNGLPTAVTANDTTFSVDAVDSLRFAVMNSAYTEAVGEGEGTIAAANWTIYDKTTFASNYSIANGLTFTNPAGGDANNYYFKILKEVPFGCTTSGSGDATTVTSPADPTSVTFDSVTTAAANVYNCLTFRVWLEGTDKSCYDTCRGQTFTFEITFGKA